MEGETVVKRFKSYMLTDDLSGAQAFFSELTEGEGGFEDDIPWDYVYQKVYLHACLKKNKRFVDWMDGLFEALEPIQKIALRQMFAYGRYLLNK